MQVKRLIVLRLRPYRETSANS